MDSEGETLNRNRTLQSKNHPRFLKLIIKKLFQGFKWVLFYLGFPIVVFLGLYYQQKYFKELYLLALKGGNRLYA
jgi:hypothetical protein